MGMEGYRETRESVEQVKQYCDSIGVTDKYTGFRHNLNRGSRNPVVLGYTWMKNTPPPVSPPPPIAASWTQYTRPRPFTTGQMDDKLGSHNQLPKDALLTTTKGHAHAERSIQERCGLNMSFPGRTEYMQRYHIKGGGKVHTPHVQELSRGYTLNPRPDYEGVARRPLARHGIERNFSEYQTRYLFPDGNTLEKFPWLRK